MNNIKDYIVVIEDAITFALCDSILNEYKGSQDWAPATTAAGKSNAERQCSTIGMSFETIINKNKNIRLPLDKYMHATAGNVIAQYNKKFSDCNIEQDSGYDLLRYEVGQFYVKHTDSFKARPRAVSCSFILNDDYEGGEFAFFNRELKYKLKKGSCIMFPSNFMYPHEIMPVTSGTRYSIITWFV
jgi:Rps23 Pro-64 3,4-dihydroxylase Tpa1-like proline 4-hydroxylase